MGGAARRMAMACHREEELNKKFCSSALAHQRNSFARLLKVHVPSLSPARRASSQISWFGSLHSLGAPMPPFFLCMQVKCWTMIQEGHSESLGMFVSSRTLCNSVLWYLEGIRHKIGASNASCTCDDQTCEFCVQSCPRSKLF